MRIELYSVLILAIALCGCEEHHNSGALMNDVEAKSDLQAIQGKRILFGHQSVGGNILQGLEEIRNSNPGRTLTVVDLEVSAPPAGAFLGEFRVGRNGDPASKCLAFREKVRSLGADGLDIAAMKFCYADFNGKSDVSAVLSDYAAAVDSLRRAFPRLVILHVTVPLEVKTAGWKKVIKRLLGKEESTDIANAKRSEFNMMLKTRYRGDSIFDLAGTESTYPDGSRERSSVDGKETYALVPLFTDDGSHLNRTGSVVAAREFVRALASVAQKSGL